MQQVILARGFLHAKVRQVYPLLPAVDAQHDLLRKGWAAVLAFGVIRGNVVDQCSPGNHEFHIGQQFLLAGFFDAQAQIKAALLPGL